MHTEPPWARSLRLRAGAPVRAAAATLLGTALVLPVAGHPIGASVAFVPALAAVLVCLHLLAAFLLLGAFRDRGDPRVLGLALAHAASLVGVLGHALAFPGAVSDHPPLATTASTAPYLFLLWQLLFVVLAGLAFAPWPHDADRVVPLAARRSVARTALRATAASAALLVAAVVAGAGHLPVLLVGSGTTRMTMLTAPLVLPVVLVAFAACERGTRGRTGPERWTPVAVLGCACALVLTYASPERYTVGWYAGRVLTLLAAGVVVASMLRSFRLLSADAEQRATCDPVTGLVNAANASAALEALVDRYHRSGDPVAVVCLDLDQLAEVRHRCGHEAGDRLLAETGRALRSSFRSGDVVARAAGGVLLVLLPGTDLRSGFAATQKVRRVVAGLDASVGPLTASAGLAAVQAGDLAADDLLRRADGALFLAQEGGGDRLVVASPDQPGRPRAEARTGERVHPPR
jgi:diguanylate cyclase (GGDEF)-like protein